MFCWWIVKKRNHTEVDRQLCIDTCYRYDTMTQPTFLLYICRVCQDDDYLNTTSQLEDLFILNIRHSNRNCCRSSRDQVWQPAMMSSMHALVTRLSCSLIIQASFTRVSCSLTRRCSKYLDQAVLKMLNMGSLSSSSGATTTSARTWCNPGPVTLGDMDYTQLPP